MQQNPSTILQLYITLVRPHMEYACSVWAPYTMKHYRAKPSAQLPKDMHILHCCYKFVDNHLEIVRIKSCESHGHYTVP